MGSIKLRLLFALAVILVVSCGTGPKQGKSQNTETAPVQTETAPAVEAFNPVSISQEYYDATKEDIQRFIGELNQIIRRRNYNAWKETLSPKYFAEISSKEYLQQISEYQIIKQQNIVLKDAEDYFRHVFIPSRANSRVDDIEFIDRNRVKVITINTNRAGEEQRLILFSLEKSGDKWRIIN